MTRDAGESFFARWVRLKRDAGKASEGRDGAAGMSSGTSAAVPQPGPPEAAKRAAQTSGEPGGGPEVPVLPPVDTLDFASDFAPFMQPEVPPELKRKALLKLFASDHFRTMDRLDVYIDDYGVFEPIAAGALDELLAAQAACAFGDDAVPRPDEEGMPHPAADPAANPTAEPAPNSTANPAANPTAEPAADHAGGMAAHVSSSSAAGDTFATGDNAAPDHGAPGVPDAV